MLRESPAETNARSQTEGYPVPTQVTGEQKNASSLFRVGDLTAAA
jgi:hypothetical protein